ncbi:MAG TPA: YggT family protein [Alphaproteobacteria bacterium]|nr:YggT family protein [Alphaproteobacteria bacterium]
MNIFLGKLLMLALDICFWIIIVQVIMSWLLAFQVINPSNPQARNLIQLLQKVTDPVYRPLRKFIPPIAGIDLTPIIVIFGISLAKNAVASVFFF